MQVLTFEQISTAIKTLLRQYNADHALLFGSYARGDADETSDIDVIVVGGPKFRPRDIFSFGEDLRSMTGKSVDAFEMREVNVGTPFYENLMREGVRIA